MSAQDIVRPALAQADSPSWETKKADHALAGMTPHFEVEAVTVELRLSLIDVRDRLRPVRQSAVDDLIVALTEGVLGHPITVRPVEGRFELVIGAHRLEAYRQMGRLKIPAIVRSLSALEARQLEIDENLVRAGLTALERLTFMAERIETWAARNPDKVVMDASQPVKLRGRPPKAFLKLRKVDGYVPAMMGFVAETAHDTGLSRQSVYRAVQTLGGLQAGQQARLHGTWIAGNDAALRQLAGIGEAEEQAKVIDLMLAGKTKNVAEARALAAGVVPAAKTAPSNTVQRDFEKAWKAATPSQRDALLHWLAGQRLPQGWTILKQGEG
ncbi:MAG: hypothetical protein DCF29_07965 [Alphaproteobacteria bacterium]|nr:MAG: hypothetical protein DCF29_07965 [Alphaproteobacteria bacterium]